MKLSTLLAAAALCMTSGAALADSYGNDDKPAHTDVSYDYVADAKGMTVYIFDNDAWEKSSCYDGCAADWPPFHAKKDAVAYGHFTVMKRADNSYQWAWQGKPLYYWKGDKNPGDTYGDGMGGLWHVVYH